MSSPRWQYLEVSWTQRWREAESPVQGFVFVFVFVFIIYIDTQECTQSFSSFPTHHLVFCPFVLPYFHNFSPHKVRAKVSSSTVRRSHSVDTILEQNSEQGSRCIIINSSCDYSPQESIWVLESRATIWLFESRATRIHDL